MLKWAYLCGLAAAAAPNNTFTFGNARITVHTPALLRLEWSANATFDDRPTLAFINRAVATCTFTASTSNGTLSLNTTALKLRYSGNGSSFSNDNLAISFMLRPGEWHTWTPAGPGTTQCGTLAGQDRVDCGVANPNATSCAAANCCFDPDVNGTNYDQHLTHCYRKTIGGTNNLLGSVSTMDCDLGLDQCITWYKAQMNQGLVSRDGWVLVDDSSNAALNSSDFTSSIPWRQERPWTTSYTDWYFFGHGHDYKSAVHDYTLVGGPVNLMDIQGYGIWHSYYHKYTAAEYNAVVDSYKNLSLPLHVAVLDMDWHTEPNLPGCDSYGGYWWNSDLFPSPHLFTSNLKAQSLKIIVNTHDVTGVDHCQDQIYTAMAKAMGVDPATNATIQCRLQDPLYAQALYDNVLDPLTNGSKSFVDWYWTDWGKDDNVWYRCVGDTASQPMLWSNYLHCQRAAAQGQRGLVLTPYGGLGNHRYPQVGSGDTDVGYETLQFEVYSTLTAANVLTPWTHDLGGFHQTAFLWPTPEMWLRWIQFGVFSPSFRTHCTHDGYCEPWAFWVELPELEPIIIATFQLRSALLPYIYTTSYLTTQTGVTISYPMYYEWPEVAEAYNITDQYMFGSDMMAAPVVNWFFFNKSIWIPPGTWVEWYTNTAAIYTGPLRLPERAFGQSEIPVFVRGGAIIPTKTMTDAVVPPVAPARLVLLAFPSGPEGLSTSANVYEDEGEGLVYQSGAFRMLNVTQDARSNTTFVVTITPCAGGNGYAGEPTQRAFSVQFVTLMRVTPTSVTSNGVAIPAANNGTSPGWWLGVQGAYPTIEVSLASASSCASARVVVTL